MRIKNNSAEQPTIPHGDAAGLFPVEELDVSTIRNREAVLALETVEDFEYVRVGRRVESGPNHSLSEFGSSA